MNLRTFFTRNQKRPKRIAKPLGEILQEFTTTIDELEYLQNDRNTTVVLNCDRIKRLRDENERCELESQRAVAVANKLRDLIDVQP